MIIKENKVLSYKKMMILLYGIGSFVAIVIGVFALKEKCIELAGILEILQEQVKRTSMENSYLLEETVKIRVKEAILIWCSHSFKSKIMIHMGIAFYEGFSLTLGMVGWIYHKGVRGFLSFWLCVFPHRIILIYLIYFSLRVCCFEKINYIYSKKEKAQFLLKFILGFFLEIIFEVYLNEMIFIKFI